MKGRERPNRGKMGGACFFPLYKTHSFLDYNIIMVTARKTTKIIDRTRGSLEQSTGRRIIPDLLQKKFEQLSSIDTICV